MLLVYTKHLAAHSHFASVFAEEQMNYVIEFDREEDGRWIAEISALPGAMSYGNSKEEAESKVQAIALRTIADMLERENTTTDHVQFAAA
jgi:predicted RNase H-like HicB family nuclease